MSRIDRERKAKERNVSAGVLLRMFNDHQLESLSDIAELYRGLERVAGFRNMQFQEYVSSSGRSGGTHALELLQQLKRWKSGCDRWGLDSDSVVLLARDNLPIAHIMKILHYPRVRVVLHQQCCLTVWSIDKDRCGRGELEDNLERMNRNDLGTA